jgi:hypothetical protein
VPDVFTAGSRPRHLRATRLCHIRFDAGSGEREGSVQVQGTEQACQVPGCTGSASAFVLDGEVYLGLPQQPARVVLCARHAAVAAGTDVRRPRTRR